MMLEEERENIYRALEKYDSYSQYYLPDEDLNRVNYLLSCLCDFLNADAEPVRHGHWIDIDSESYTWKVRCSECGHERSMMSTQGEYPKYCEECGAKMDGE